MKRIEGDEVIFLGSKWSPPEEKCDERIAFVDDDGEICAHAALWWNHVPAWEHQRCGMVGGFFAYNAECAHELLLLCEASLRKHRCDIAIGPMNGNTWRRHRWVSWSNGRAPFFLEPRNEHGDELQWWRQVGYQTLACYNSSVLTMSPEMSTPERVIARLQSKGVRLRNLEMKHFTEDLKAIHAVSERAFVRNFLCTPLICEDFLQQYQKVKSIVDPRLVFLAEDNVGVCGFVFCVADVEALQRGDRPALIVKTLAVDDGYAGLGNWLVDCSQQAARSLGYEHAIHALQRDQNSAHRITDRCGGTIFRRYELLYKKLL
jgi:hypothetical protein